MSYLLNLIKKYKNALSLALLLGLTLILMLPYTPVLETVPSRDSGIYHYIGTHMLEGEVPYKDIWDHKGPMIYFINAFGLGYLAGDWGLWAIQVVSVFVAIFLLYKMLKNHFSYPTAFLGIFVIATNLAVLLGESNLTETYALPMQVVAIWAFLRFRTSKNQLFMFIIGLTAAIVVLLRPNLVGVWAGLALYYLFTFKKYSVQQHTRNVLTAVFGFIIPFIPTFLYFAYNNALAQMYDQYLRYNFIYSNVSIIDRLQVFLAGISYFNATKVVYAVLAGWLLATFLTIKNIFTDKQPNILIVLAVIIFPIEMMLTSISGRTFGHYFLAWIPAVTIFTGYFIYLLEEKNNIVKHIHLYLFLVIFIGNTFMRTSLETTLNRARTRTINDHYLAAQYIRDKTEPTDKVLIWGAEASLNYITGRESPTRFVYQYPLYTPGYVNDKLLAEFRKDVLSGEAELIVDAHGYTDRVLPISKDVRETWSSGNPFYTVPAEMHFIADEITKRYRAKEKVGRFTMYYKRDSDELIQE